MSYAEMAANAPTMRTYSIELPDHVLRFSLPEEIARQMPEYRISKRFDSEDPAFKKDGFQNIAGWLHDFNGPFWIGAYGSLKFHFFVQHVRPDYPKKVRTQDELDTYVHWWNRSLSKFNFIIEKAALNGMACTRRSTTTAPPDAEHREIYSLRLSDELFLDVGFTIIEWKTGRTKSWKPKAEALREAIKQTIVLESRLSS